MITKIIARNYRAFESLDIPLTKINLFLGPNNAGKSSILSVINLLAQTIDSADRDTALLLTGKFEDLGAYQDVVYQNNPKLNISLGLEFATNRLPKQLRARSFGLSVTYHYRSQRRQTVVRSLELYAGQNDIILKTRIAEKGRNQLVEKVGEKFGNVALGIKSSGSVLLEHFLPFYFAPVHREAEHSPPKRRFQRALDLEDVLYISNRVFRQHMSGVEFIGPFRRGPERIYTYSGETPSTVGVHGERAVDLIVADYFRRSSKKINIAETISAWMQKSQMAKSLQVLPLSDRHFEVRLVHYDTNEAENLADVGYGCSQILPILAAGYSLNRESILVVEQPEIHLHPRAEAEVGTFLYDVSNRNVQIIVETHSEHLMMRLQSFVAAGLLSPDDIFVYYVYPEGGRKVYQRIPLARDGFFAQEWPKGFFPERLREAENIAKYSIAGRQQAKKPQ